MALTTKQILNQSMNEVSKLSEKELRQQVSILRSTARKRAERLVKIELYSEAYRHFSRKSPNTQTIIPTVKDMDITTLRNEYKRYKNFLEAKTSTVSGARKNQKNIIDTIKEKTGVTLSANDIGDFFDIYGTAKDFEVGRVLNYNKVMETVGQIYDEHPDWSKEKILQTAQNELIQTYEQEHIPRTIYPSEYTP